MRKPIIYLFSLSFLFTFQRTLAQNFELKEWLNSYDLEPYMQILEDSDGQYTFEEIRTTTV